MFVTRPSVSVVMTPSPMLASVIFSSSARAVSSAVTALPLEQVAAQQPAAAPPRRRAPPGPTSGRWRRQSSSSAADWRSRSCSSASSSNVARTTASRSASICSLPRPEATASRAASKPCSWRSRTPSSSRFTRVQASVRISRILAFCVGLSTGQAIQVVELGVQRPARRDVGIEVAEVAGDDVAALPGLGIGHGRRAVAERPSSTSRLRPTHSSASRTPRMLLQPRAALIASKASATAAAPASLRSSIRLTDAPSSRSRPTAVPGGPARGRMARHSGRACLESPLPLEPRPCPARSSSRPRCRTRTPRSTSAT